MKYKKKFQINLPESSEAFVHSKRNIIRNKINELILINDLFKQKQPHFYFIFSAFYLSEESSDVLAA